MTEQDLAGWQDILSMAIKLAGNCHAAYLKARPSVRRRFNEAVLQAVYVKEEDRSGGVLRDVRPSFFSTEFELAPESGPDSSVREPLRPPVTMAPSPLTL